jgi:hypothetical protein
MDSFWRLLGCALVIFLLGYAFAGCLSLFGN